RHRLTCACCGTTTCADLPPGVPSGQSGPRLVAFAGLLRAYVRQSKRRTALFLETLLNQPCGPALTVNMQTLVTTALRPAYADLGQQLPTQPTLGIDVSPTKEGATVTVHGPGLDLAVERPDHTSVSTPASVRPAQNHERDSHRTAEAQSKRSTSGSVAGTRQA